MGAPLGARPRAQRTLAVEGEINRKVLDCGSDWDPVLTVLVIYPFFFSWCIFLCRIAMIKMVIGFTLANCISQRTYL